MRENLSYNNILIIKNIWKITNNKNIFIYINKLSFYITIIQPKIFFIIFFSSSYSFVGKTTINLTYKSPFTLGN